MRRRFQAGGLAEAQSSEEGLYGILGQLNTTNPEAQRWATEYLEEYQGYDWQTEEELLEKFQETAEESRTALRTAREATLANKFDPSRRWLALAEGLGAPTRTGAFGESLSNAAAALRPVHAARQQFGTAQDERLLELDQALAGVDTSMLTTEFQLQKLRQGQRGDLATQAARIMGKTVQRPRPPGGNLPPAIKSLDQKMATKYTEWVTGEQEYSIAKEALLTDAIEKLGQQDNLSGPWIGLIPKMARDIFLPESANVQEVIETVAQESLKKILGGQFGQREGEMLLERTFNPRLGEAANRKRAQTLMIKIKRANDEQRRAMQYFEDNQTMYGYKGKTDWTLDEFMPEEELKRYTKDGEPIWFPISWEPAQRQEYFDKYGRGVPPPDGLAEGGRVSPYKQGGKVRRRRKRKKKYAAGGVVEGYPKKEKSPQSLHLRYGKRASFQTGGEVDEEDSDWLDSSGSDWLSGEDSIIPGPGATALGVGVGVATGLAVEEVGTRIHEGVTGRTRPPEGEQLVGSAMEVSGIEPAEAVAEVKRGRRQRVPSVLLDESGRVTQRLGERAMVAGGSPGDEALGILEERFSGSEERVGNLVERGLRTPEFHASEQKLTDNLYQRAKPLYKKAYEEGQSLPMPKYWDDWMKRPYSRQAIDIAFEFMAAEGKGLGKVDATGMTTRPSLEFMDQLKRGFDQLIRTEEKGMGATPKSRILKQQRGQLMTYLNKVAPDSYKLAREQYKGDLEVLEALDIGRAEFHRLSPEEARLMIADMSWSERGALRTGVAQRIYDIIYNPSSDVDGAKRILGSRNMRQRLQLLFEKPSDWRIFEAALDREMKMFQSDKGMKRRVDSGRTAVGVGEVLEGRNPLQPAKEMISKGPLMWVLRLVGWGRRGGGLNEQQADEVVEILMKKDLKELEKYVPQLEYARDYARTRRGRRGKAAIAGGVIGLGMAVGDAFGEEEAEYDEQDLETIREALRIEMESE